MNKKFLSAVLFGALMVTSTGTFVSCKDYDDDIDRIDKELTDLKSAISELQSKIDNGKYVTDIVKEGDGLKITWNDNSTSTIETIKGDKGDKTIVTIVDGYWAFDGVKSEYPATPEAGEAGTNGHDAKISEDGYWMVWDTAKGEYVKTEYIAGGVTAAEVKGGWELTVKDENGEEQVIFVPTGSTMGYMDVWNPEELFALYGINDADVAYSPYKKTLKKGLYTTLDRDLKVVVNPQGTDASAYSYKLENTEGTNTELLFKEAVPFKGLLSARATSSNGVWVLPHDYMRYDNNNLSDIRTNLYLKFKSNDGKAHALALTATLNETTIKTPYDLAATLREIDPDQIKVGIKNIDKCYVNTLYTPVYTSASKDSTAVYDYWLTLEQSTQNLKNAAMFGVEIPESEEGHTFKYTKEAGVYNPIIFVYNYILMDGTVVQGAQAPTFTANLTDELATSTTMPMADFIAPFDAEKITATNTELTYMPNEDAANTRIASVGKVFGMTKEYDLTEFVNAMDDNTKLVWNNALTQNSISSLNSIEASLIGGEGDNNAEWINARLLKNIRFEFSGTDNNKLKVQFLVSNKWSDINSTYTVGTTNFKLDNAYELTLTVKDEQARNTVATITMPFELQQPTLDITRTNDKFSVWSDDEATLISYGAYKITSGSNYTMYLPMYEAFKAWTTEYTVYDDNAGYYKLQKVASIAANGVTLLGTSRIASPAPLDDKLTYSTTWDAWNTYATGVEASAGGEKVVPVDADFKHYGVYAEEKAKDFNLVFASLLNHSTLEMAGGKENLVVNTGTHDVFISNDDLNFQTPMGGKFYLFDGIDANENVVERKTLNQLSFNEEQRPFMLVNDVTDIANFSAKAKNGTTTYNFASATAGWKIDYLTGKLSYTIGAPDANNIKVYAIPAAAKRQAVTGEVGDISTTMVGGHTGGMVIQLPTAVADQEEVEITLTISDMLGYEKELKFVVKKIQ